MDREPDWEEDIKDIKSPQLSDLAKAIIILNRMSKSNSNLEALQGIANIVSTLISSRPSIDNNTLADLYLKQLKEQASIISQLQQELLRRSFEPKEVEDEPQEVKSEPNEFDSLGKLIEKAKEIPNVLQQFKSVLTPTKSPRPILQFPVKPLKKTNILSALIDEVRNLRSEVAKLRGQHIETEESDKLVQATEDFLQSEPLNSDKKEKVENKNENETLKDSTEPSTQNKNNIEKHGDGSET